MAILGVGQVAVEAAVAPGDGLVGEHDSCDSLHDSLVTAYLGSRASFWVLRRRALSSLRETLSSLLPPSVMSMFMSRGIFVTF